MAVAALALVGVLVSAYLLLFKLGFVGSIACGGSGGCERVATSPWAVLFGIPVAAYGVGGYLLMLGVALVGLDGRWLRRPEPTVWLIVLSAVAVLFAVYLTYLELFVIHAICRWCVVSAVLVTAILGASLAGLRALRSAPGP